MKIESAYIADDGQRFTSETECKEYETKAMFNKLAKLTIAQIAGIPRTVEDWKASTSVTKDLALLFEAFANGISAARRGAGDMKRAVRAKNGAEEPVGDLFGDN